MKNHQIDIAERGEFPSPVAPMRHQGDLALQFTKRIAIELHQIVDCFREERSDQSIGQIGQLCADLNSGRSLRVLISYLLLAFLKRGLRRKDDRTKGQTVRHGTEQSGARRKTKRATPARHPCAARAPALILTGSRGKHLEGLFPRLAGANADCVR